MFSLGDKIYYFEYVDHAFRYGNPTKLLKDPLILVAVGKIVSDSEDFIAVLTSGTKNVNPSSSPGYEIIYKKAIIKKKLIYEVEA